jgi:enoyl-[acyl-carrier protein] reductase II
MKKRGKRMNRVLAHTGVQYPILQAPMGWIARSQLASAVSNAGGLGIIETSSGEVDQCLAEIAKVRELTDKPFGVNLPLLFIREPRVVDLVAGSGVKFVTTSAGSPAKLLPVLKAAGLIVYHVVPNLSSALKAVEAGVDGLIVEGGEGGGFKNPDDVSTLVLLQAVRERTDVPLVAAGGICDGRGMAAAFALGAEGVQMGTRFVSSAESPVHGNYKQAIVDAKDTGTVMLNRKSSPCVRALKTERANEIDRAGGFDRAIFGSVKEVYFGGDMEASLALAGQTVGLIHEVLPVADIIGRTVEGFHAIRKAQGERSLAGGF